MGPLAIGQPAALVSGSNPVPVTGTVASTSADLVALIGEVQASPTANTLLARLKDLLSLIVLGAGTNTIGGTRDAGPAWTSVFGVSGVAVVSADITTAAAVTDAPTAGQKICVDDIIVSVDAACNVLFEVETSGADVFKCFFPGAGTYQITPRSKIKLGTADKKLTAKTNTAVNVGITVGYHSEA